MIRQRRPSDPLTDFAEAALESASLYKEEAIRKGFSPEAAEALAITFHSVLMASVYEDEGVDNPQPID
jgi:hypothetical protein